jgi:hypothetical protein
MHLKLSAIAFASILSVSACGDDDPFEDGGSASPDGGADGSVKDSGPTEDSGTDTETDSGTDTEADAG